LLILLIMLTLAVGSSDSNETGSDSNDDKISAWVMAKDFVKERLKSPSTADFGGVFSDYQDPDSVVTVLGGGKYVVRAWVDSQNGFGATIRTRFVCKLEDMGNDRWRCTSCVFLP
ncbi:MAG: hypothetical protein VXB01_18420, partial [Opitutae bacterium]